MPKISLFLALVVLGAAGQDKPNDFLLDSSRPYVYLKFDHIGPLKPQQEGEGGIGLWLRIVNNCRVPIAVRSFGVNTGDPGVGVLYEVIPIAQPDIVISGDSGIPIGETGGEMQISPPKGYSAELSSITRIAPGKDLLFSVPRNHVSNNWFIRVKFWLAIGSSPGPFSQLDFLEDQVPQQRTKEK
jgi:hypothetical protein